MNARIERWWHGRWMGWIGVAWWSALAACGAATPTPGTAGGDGGPEARFQNALLLEEGQRDYVKAIAEYEGVIVALDEQRRLAASAVYRLGECFRKLGRTNEAVAQYERLLREFSGEESLVRLGRQNLAGLGWRDSASGGTAEATSGAARDAGPAVGTREERGAAQRAPTNEEAEEIRRIEALVANSPDLINALDGTGQAPLHVAAAKGQLLVARYLLDHGARLGTVSRGGDSPLHVAVMAGHKAMVTLLLDRGAEVNRPTSSKERRTSALHLAAGQGFMAMAALLLERGADLQALSEADHSSYDGTPLFVAIHARRLEVARLLLEKGADPNRRGEGKRLPLTVASTPELVALLLEFKADPNADGGERLFRAAERNERQVVRALLDAGAGVDAESPETGRTALFATVAGKLRPQAEELLERGANINRISRGAALSPFQVLLGFDLDWLRWGLDRGGDPNARDAKGQTPLELTGFLRVSPREREPAPAAGGAVPMGLPRPLPAVVPVAVGPVPSFPSQPSNVSAASGSGSELSLPWARAVLLMRRGAKIDEPMSYWNSTAVHVVAWLAGTNELAEVTRAGGSLEARASGGITPLMIATGNQRPEMMDALLRAGVDVNATNDLGNTALHYAAARGNKDAFERLLREKADPGRADRFGRTARWLLEGREGVGFNQQRLGFDMPSFDPQHFPVPGGAPAYVGIPVPLSGRPSAVLAEMLRLLPPAPDSAKKEAEKPLPLMPGKVIVFGALQSVVNLEANKATTLSEALIVLPRSPTANLRQIKLHRPSGGDGQEASVQTFDLEELLRRPDRASDPVLRPGDRIEVGEKKF